MGDDQAGRDGGTWAAWLAAYPAGLVGAALPDGTPAPLPAGVPVGPGHQIDGRSLLDLVDPGDASAVTTTFVNALTDGVAVARVRLVGDGGTRRALVHYLDAREEHGVVLRLVAADDEREAAALSPGDLLAVRPRLAVMHKDEVARIVAVDEATTAMLGWSAEELVGRQSIEFIHPDDRARAIDNWMRRRADGAAGVQSVRLRYLRKDGGWLWVETSNHDRTAEGGWVVGQMIDISDEMAATEALRRSEALLRRITEVLPVGLAHLTPDRGLAFVNPRLEAMFEGRMVARVEDLAAHLAGSDWAALDGSLSAAMLDGKDRDLEVRLLGGGSQPDRMCQVALRPVTDGAAVTGVLACVVDVTDLKEEASRDALTGLYNRASVTEALRRALERHPRQVGVIFIDLDRFKPVNDRHGHEVGDQVLRTVADRLEAAVRDNDVVGRIGGDEFLVVCDGAGRVDDVVAVAARLRDGLGSDLPLAVGRLRVGASMGIAHSATGSAAGEDQAVTPDELISRADTAMYTAKQSRSPQPAVWSPAVGARPLLRSVR